jgi:hypothetical protein
VAVTFRSEVTRYGSKFIVRDPAANQDSFPITADWVGNSGVRLVKADLQQHPEGIELQQETFERPPVIVEREASIADEDHCAFLHVRMLVWTTP